jgi:hypothetical protein
MNDSPLMIWQDYPLPILSCSPALWPSTKPHMAARTSHQFSGAARKRPASRVQEQPLVMCRGGYAASASCRGELAARRQSLHCCLRERSLFPCSQPKSLFFPHERMMDLYHAASTCAAGSGQEYADTLAPKQCDIDGWINATSVALALTAKAGYSLADVPYASFPSHLAAHHFKDSLFVLLERNASEWASKRLSDHDGTFGTNPVCSESLWSLVSNPFDLYECATACLTRGGSTSLVSCLTSLSNVSHAGVVHAYKMQMRAVHALFGDRLVRIDLFAKSGGVPTAKLASTLDGITFMITLCVVRDAFCGFGKWYEPQSSVRYSRIVCARMRNGQRPP